MASAGSALSGAASGAATGTMVMPGWGTAIGAGVGLLSSLLGGDGGASQQQGLARDQLQNALNQQEYQKALNAIALNRGAAGSTDAYGSTVRYDPATNSWVSSLGAMPQRIQDAENASTLQRNAVDVPQASANNIASSVLASENRRGISGAVNTLNNYTPTNEAALRGALQDASTRANQATQQPLIQDTLRQFARTGSAAGPVLARMGRENATALSQEMDNNVIQAAKGSADIDASRRSALASPIQTLSGAGTPNMSYAPMTGSNPNAQLASLIASRAQGAAAPASSGAIASAYGTGGATQGYNSAIAAAGNQPGTAMWGSVGRQAGSLFDSVTSPRGGGQSIADQVMSWFGSGSGGSGNNADESWNNRNIKGTLPADYDPTYS